MEQNNGVIQESKNINKNFSLDKSSLLIIVLLFMFSSKLWDIAWDIGKSLLYIIAIIYTINFINPALSISLKNIIYELINVDNKNNFIINILSQLLTLLKSLPIFSIFTAKQNIPTDEKLITSSMSGNKPLSNVHQANINDDVYLNGGNTKNLSNIDRSDHKNMSF
jgi:hypothetical protein